MPSLNSQLTPLGKGQIWIIFSLFYDGSSLYIEGGGLNGARSIYFVSYWDNHPSFTSHFILELYSHVCTHYGAILHPDMKLFKSVFYRMLLYNTISWAFDNRIKVSTSFSAISLSQSILAQNSLIKLLFHRKLQLVIFSCFKAATICENK